MPLIDMMIEKNNNLFNEKQESKYIQIVWKKSRKELFELLWIELPEDYETIFDFLKQKDFPDAFEKIEQKFPSLSPEERYKLADILAKILQFDKIQDEDVLTSTEQKFIKLANCWISLVNGFEFLVDDEKINRFFSNYTFEEKMRIKYIINTLKIYGRWYNLPLPVKNEDYHFINFVMFAANQSLTRWIETR